MALRVFFIKVEPTFRTYWGQVQGKEKGAA